ncbi:hypothetical protein [Citreimonas salinaria]|uniref:Uncharacterized protein n=1 Tax=Citreimonas salinaria TaxID=321339 RepID=A0A1H3H3R6_9RHOB|nr:hypothetical protein [Citreimonas salinaria]SDY09279.1 hypothetical protein SAMN05444340_103168 [Citreimonas salinaria]
MTASRTLYAAIAIPDAGGLWLKTGLDAAATALALHDPRDGAPLRHPRKPAVHGGALSLRVTSQEGGARGHRLLFEIFGPDATPVGREPATPRDRVAVAVLADVVATTLRLSGAPDVEWAAPRATIGRDEFLSLHDYVSPRRARRTARAALRTGGAALHAESSLRRAFARWRPRRGDAPSPHEARLGAAGWALTALLATVSLPVAALISVVGLTRGMNFRMTAHALVVTLLVMALLDDWPGFVHAATLLN